MNDEFPPPTILRWVKGKTVDEEKLLAELEY
jgi:hypothetical protein